MTDNDAEKEEARRRAETRLRQEVASFRRKEEAEIRRFRYGCIGFLTLLVLALVAVFLLS